MRIATWNLNAPFTSGDKRLEQWEWLEHDLKADVAVLTEAQVPKTGVPNVWNAVFKEDGIDESRRWGTIIAARNLELRDVTNGANGRDGFSVTHTWPGTVAIADIVKSDKILATVAGIYSMNLRLNGKKAGNGFETTSQIIHDLCGLFESPRSKKLILMGDLNLFPDDVPGQLREELDDMVEYTAQAREEYGYCYTCPSDALCGHMWTHKNKRVPDRIQNLDYIFASKKIRKRTKSVLGGDKDFPQSWSLSDHSPVVIDLSI